MSFSVSDSTTFANIDWSTLKNRPIIDGEQFCTEKNWFDDVPCCMSRFSIEYVTDTAYDNGFGDSPEVEFLKQSPCLNGVELDVFLEKFSSKTIEPSLSQSPNWNGTWSSIINSIKRLFD